MDSKRLELHQKLIDVLGSSNVYFQPPESIKMKYDCIVYNRQPNQTMIANDGKYISVHAYSLTFISRNADSDIPDKIEKLPMCRMDRVFISDNLYHTTFTIYY